MTDGIPNRMGPGKLHFEVTFGDMVVLREMLRAEAAKREGDLWTSKDTSKARERCQPANRLLAVIREICSFYADHPASRVRFGLIVVDPTE